MADVNELAVPAGPRIIAVVLAVGGLCWGMFLLLALGPTALIFLPFSAGFMVTAGYIVRAVIVPPLEARRAIWAASILGQGGWLVLIGLPELARQGPDLCVLWWVFATVCSVVALTAERETPVADEAMDYDDAALYDPSLTPEHCPPSPEA